MKGWADFGRKIGKSRGKGEKRAPRWGGRSPRSWDHSSQNSGSIEAILGLLSGICGGS